MEFEKVTVYIEDDFLCDLIGIKNVLKYNPEQVVLDFIKYTPRKDIQIIVFETSNGIDYAKIIAEKTLLGIRAETNYGMYLYPGFEKEMQSLLFLKINETFIPCDKIIFKNNDTGEEKEIYYDISSFYGEEYDEKNNDK